MGIRVKRNGRFFVHVAVWWAFLLCLVSQPSVYATETSVDAIVCNPSDRIATLSITAPTDDTIIGTMPVAVKGEIRNISQIEVYVDEVYSFAESFSSDTTVFNLEVSLERGTHEVLLKGVDICNYNDITDSVVVTHQPPFEQTDEKSDATTSYDGKQQGVTAPYTAPIAQSDEPIETGGLAALDAVPILGPIIRGGIRAADATGLSAPFATGAIRGLTSTAAVIAGLVLLTNASVITHGLHLRKWSFTRGLKLPKMLQEPSRVAIILRIVGFIMLAAVYLL